MRSHAHPTNAYQLLKVSRLEALSWVSPHPRQVSYWHSSLCSADKYVLITRWHVSLTLVWNRLYPDWNCDALFLSNSFARALNLDAMRASHPIEVECLDASMAYQVREACTLILAIHKVS